MGSNRYRYVDNIGQELGARGSATAGLAAQSKNDAVAERPISNFKCMLTAVV